MIVPGGVSAYAPAYVAGSAHVPVPPASARRVGNHGVGYAMAPPGGQLSTAPYHVMLALTLTGVLAGVRVWVPDPVRLLDSEALPAAVADVDGVGGTDGVVLPDWPL